MSVIPPDRLSDGWLLLPCDVYFTERIKQLFPNTYGRPRVELVPGGDADVFNKPLHMGCVLSGGQAPGGHNVLAGVFDFAKKCSPNSKVYG